MARLQPTPLQPRQFFDGSWSGEGTLRLHPLLRWLLPGESFWFASRATWLSDAVWIVREEYRFSSGQRMSRKMFVEKIDPARLHMTADDMPRGADILLEETGFRFTPYDIETRYRGWRWRLRCVDDCRVDDQGVIHDTVRMYLHGIPVGTICLVVTVDRSLGSTDVMPPP